MGCFEGTARTSTNSGGAGNADIAVDSGGVQVADGGGSVDSTIGTASDSAAVDSGLADGLVLDVDVEAAEDTVSQISDGSVVDGSDTADALPDGAFIQDDAVCAPNDVGAVMCCEEFEGGIICHPPFIEVDAGDTDGSGCKEGQLDAAGKCISANCSGVSELLSKSLNDMTVPGGQDCTEDSECVVVDLTTDCGPGCLLGVNNSSAALYEQAVADFNVDVCVSYNIGATCNFKGNKNCVAPPTPGCDKGKCSAYKKFPTDDCPDPAPQGALCYDGVWTCPEGKALPPLGDACVAATCNNAAIAMQNWLSVTVASSAGCTQDADCQVWTSTNLCSLTCPIAISSDAKAKLSAPSNQIKSFCKQYYWSSDCVQKSTCWMTYQQAKKLGAICISGACAFAPEK